MNGPGQFVSAASAARRSKNARQSGYSTSANPEKRGHGEGEVAALHGWRGSVRDRIEAIAAPRPLDQQARLANPPASPDGGESAGPVEDSVEPPHFFRAVEKLHRRTMQKNIMFCNILFRFVPQPNAQRRQGLAERLFRHFGNLPSCRA